MACGNVKYNSNQEVLMPMSEMTGLQRKIDNLEDDLREAMRRIGKLETKLAEEDMKVCRLEREVKHEHEVLDRLEHGIPVGL